MKNKILSFLDIYVLVSMVHYIDINPIWLLPWYRETIGMFIFTLSPAFLLVHFFVGLVYVNFRKPVWEKAKSFSCS